MVRRLFLSALVALGACGVAHAQQAPVTVVFFVEWSGALDEIATDIIQQSAAAALKAPGSPVLVTGYADHKGSKQADIYLSQLRAQMVTDALVADGVPASRIRMQAAGAMPVSGVIGRRVEITLGTPH